MKLVSRFGAFIMIGSAFVALLIGRVGANQAEKKDQVRAVDGTWTPISAELSGQTMPEAFLKSIVLKLEEGKYEVTVGGKLDKGECKYDPVAMPKRLTIQGTEGPNKGKTFLCIYELSSDTLRVCYDLSGKEFPAEFATSKVTPLYLVTYKLKSD